MGGSSATTRTGSTVPVTRGGGPEGAASASGRHDKGRPRRGGGAFKRAAESRRAPRAAVVRWLCQASVQRRTSRSRRASRGGTGRRPSSGTGPCGGSPAARAREGVLAAYNPCHPLLVGARAERTRPCSRSGSARFSRPGIADERLLAWPTTDRRFRSRRGSPLLPSAQRVGSCFMPVILRLVISRSYGQSPM